MKCWSATDGSSNRNRRIDCAVLLLYCAAFADVLSRLWQREESPMPVTPSDLKSRLDRYTPRFQGYR